ncbi:MAG: FlgD immunoglobulin-like domain containing protein [Candidatus Krumholzibacteria bacterium]|jgi:hypothetical protein|nr:FlgD immunoglobulin-like domain containing protein [Candidatus Krumholzibacteria bacterium]
MESRASRSAIAAPLTAAAIVAAIAAVWFPGPATAQIAVPDTLYTSGRVSFSYAQTPFPIYSGSFLADGPALPPDGSFPPGVTEAVGGASAVTQPDSVTTVIYGATANPSGTFDGAVIALRTFGPLTAGTYPVDLTGGTGLFLFIDEAQSFSLPDTLSADGVMQWLDDLDAEHILVSLTGNINVTAASADTLHGTFNGLTVDPDNALFLVNINNGQFALSGATPTTAAPRPPVAAPAAIQAWPNPFNPRVNVVFSLPVAQRIDAAVYDLAGRRVQTLHAGSLDEGDRRLQWNGCDQADRRAPAGVYLVRVQGPAWQASVKVVLTP